MKKNSEEAVDAVCGSCYAARFGRAVGWLSAYSPEKPNHTNPFAWSLAAGSFKLMGKSPSLPTRRSKRPGPSFRCYTVSLLKGTPHDFEGVGMPLGPRKA